MIQALLHTHLTRLAIWSVFSIILGVVLLRKAQPFGVMMMAWATVNLLIVLFSWNGQPSPLAPLREFLMLNAGLDCGYIAVGLALALPKKATQALVGSGRAVAIQGLMLLVLDWILLTELPRG